MNVIGSFNKYISNYRHYSSQKINPSINWCVPEESPLASVDKPSELKVGGVYLRLFVANPGWVLRKPKEFLSELMDTSISLMSKEKPDVSLITNHI